MFVTSLVWSVNVVIFTDFWSSCYEFLALAVPGGAMAATEDCSFEISAIMAAQMGVIALDAHTILYALVTSLLNVQLKINPRTSCVTA